MGQGNPRKLLRAEHGEILDGRTPGRRADWAELVGGVDYEGSDYFAGGVTTDHSLAGYLSSTFHPAKDVELTAGLRRDDFDTVGAATTGRVGAA